MKKLLTLVLLVFLFSCDSSIKADFDTIKAKNVILVGDDGEEYRLNVKKDSTGSAVLSITPKTK